MGLNARDILKNPGLERTEIRYGALPDTLFFAVRLLTAKKQVY
jgi:hypothetical protein